MRAPGLGGPGLVWTPFGLWSPVCAVGAQCCLTSAFELLESLMGPKGPGRAWNMGMGMPMGWEEKLLPSSSESPVSGSLQTRPQKHKKMLLHHIQAAGPLLYTPAPGAPPSKPWAHPSGLSPQGGAIQSSQNGCCWHHPPPQAGALGVGRDCGPGLPSLGPLSHQVPLWSHGEQGRKRRKSTVRIHPAAEAAGAGCADALQAERPAGFCCGTWARHPHSLGGSAASRQTYLRDH